MKQDGDLAKLEHDNTSLEKCLTDIKLEKEMLAEEEVDE